MNLRAVLFDLDGTLVDSVDGLMKCFSDALENLNLADQQDRLLELCNGKSVQEISRILSKASDCMHAQRKFQEEYMDAVARSYLSAPPINGALDLVEHTIELGLKTALVTSAPRQHVQICLHALRWDHLFQMIVCGDEVVQTKPHPECYLKACLGLNVSPASTLVIEDSAPGARAGREAGCNVWLVNRDGDFSVPCDHKFATLEQAKYVLTEIVIPSNYEPAS